MYEVGDLYLLLLAQSLLSEGLKIIFLSLNETYWIDFGSGNKRALNFNDYGITQVKGLSSQSESDLYIKFYMNDKVKIKSNQKTLESNELIIIDAACQLSLQTIAGRHILNINLYRQEDRRMYIRGYYFFNTFISPKDAENLMHNIKGETVVIGWRINGYASAIIHPKKYFPIMRFDVSNLEDATNTWHHITPDQYNSKILQRLGLNEKFVAEFPFQIPSTITAHPTLPTAIKGMQTDLNTLIINLKNAVNVLRNPRSINDYRHVMDQVKTSVETIRKYINGNKEALAKEIFIDTGVIADVDRGGAEQAAKDVMEKLGNILESVYQISSKPAHGMPRKGQAQLKFNFSPESSDAEFVLIVALASARYMRPGHNLVLPIFTLF